MRADSLRALTEDGWRALADYGVRVAVDLRSDLDAAADPPGDLPIDVVRLPVNGHEVPVVAEWPSMTEAYVGMLDRFAPEFAAAVAAVAEADDPVVIHCLAGRDRTGLVSALMLRLAGTDIDAIAVDHARSDEYLAPWWQPWYDAASDDVERARRMRVTSMPDGAMAEVLADVDARAYLVAGGADEAALDRLAARLRGEV